MKVTKVKITAIPPGGAPLAIRQQWVGLELPLIKGDLEPGIFRSVTGGKPDPRSFGGFPVKTKDAIKALHDANKEEAARWWEAWFFETGGTGRTLVFAPSCGELVVEAAAELPKKHVAAMTAANKRKWPYMGYRRGEPIGSPCLLYREMLYWRDYGSGRNQDRREAVCRLKRRHNLY